MQGRICIGFYVNICKYLSLQNIHTFQIIIFSLNKYSLLDYWEIHYKHLCLQSELINRVNTAGHKDETFFMLSKHIQESAGVKWYDMVESQGNFVDKVAKVCDESPANFQWTWDDIVFPFKQYENSHFWIPLNYSYVNKLFLQFKCNEEYSRFTLKKPKPTLERVD